MKARRLHGVDLSLRRQATVQDLMYHESTVKESERGHVEINMLRHNVDVLKGKTPHTNIMTQRTIHRVTFRIVKS